MGRQTRADEEGLGAVEVGLEGAEHLAGVPGAPRIGQPPGGRLACVDGQCLDIAGGDGLLAGPGGDLLDLALELVEVVADECDERLGTPHGRPGRRGA